MKYEAVIGLEVHVQLKTASKMFTSVPYRFGEEPNSLIDPVVMALPGSLPVINREAVAKSVQVGILLGCDIAKTCKWDRKNYFYPDSPKNYQISQYDQPLCLNGSVEIEVAGPSRSEEGPHRNVQLTRIHLEEDVGKLTHFDRDSLVDYNRAGTPLIEIVTEPDIYSADEAFAFLTALRRILVYAGISDCDMEKGQLRCDANISIRPVGSETLGTKVELKNLNSISGVRNGVAYEIARQKQVLSEGGSLVQETRRWDADRNMTTSMRTKEEAHDYRYFPDPDLMPVSVSEEWKAELAKDLPEVPFDRQRRYQEDFGLPYSSASVLISDRMLADFFESAVTTGGSPALLANFVVNDLSRELSAGEEGVDLSNCKVEPAGLSELVKLVEENVISNQIAREVLNEMLANGGSPRQIVKDKGLEQSSDEGELETLCREAIAANEKAVNQYKEGNAKAINAVKGYVMKATKGKANPKVVNDLIEKLVNE
ncbi:Asp-tRNA(Asn)/Glu-tRNA(Gln) amidotransferase subunit GatB [Puniceicoccus vermicola]|uniref:Aspartyl/glutamyl-tRNA(Asn/Gln) amidotransferase subunit B n=1 Tax=Puniceicoccus vermicola TaxID=388746 RepID=A0A7X1E4B9_9BACT|nr:Asp-tRNA(Asn)/Glu-tRNA(Gln) amidotransferase subunit GatB [Puniceicoccus vermicola]MBC2601879.1 Asp-tRNA(Asn)/Glu-tRNA(Gln) amidotransferase subunit GatB [Puniceicoccus vermicola]